MVEKIIKLPNSLPGGEIIAVEVSEDDYMRDYAETFHEWVQGVVTKMSPVSLKHDQLTTYFRRLLESYFALRSIGEILRVPFVIRLPSVKSRREPDLQIILKPNTKNIKETYMDGAADICIEVASPGSVAVDYGEKLNEYERGGVREYWIIDPMRESTTFYRLNEKQKYHAIQPNSQHIYTTPLLPNFKFDVAVLWHDELPDIITTVKSVQDMLKDE